MLGTIRHCRREPSAEIPSRATCLFGGTLEGGELRISRGNQEGFLRKRQASHPGPKPAVPSPWLTVTGEPKQSTARFNAALLSAEDYGVPAPAFGTTVVECLGAAGRIGRDFLHGAIVQAGNPRASARQNVTTPIGTLTAGRRDGPLDRCELIVEPRRWVWSRRVLSEHRIAVANDGGAGLTPRNVVQPDDGSSEHRPVERGDGVRDLTGLYVDEAESPGSASWCRQNQTDPFGHAVRRKERADLDFRGFVRDVRDTEGGYWLVDNHEKQSPGYHRPKSACSGRSGSA